MRNPGGYAIWASPDADIAVVEKDTFTCVHCNTVVAVLPMGKGDQGGFCMRCMKNICGPCADLGRCQPFEKWLEAVEKKITNKVEADRQYSLLLAGPRGEI